MATQEIWIDDYQYRYAFYPHTNPDAPYCIFLMGTLQEIESVEYFSQYFSNTLNVFVVEVPGTGLTQPLPAFFSMHDQAQMLLSFITKMSIPSAHIMAISYATPIAVEICGLWPEALSLSMCGGTAGVVSSLRPATMSLLADAIHDRKLFAERFIDGMTVNDKNIPRGKVIARSARQRIFRHSEQQMMCFCENTIRLLTYKPSTSIKSIHQPSLLFVGEKDPYVTVEKASELANLLPNCIFKTVENADHLVHLEYPELTAKLLIQLSKMKNHPFMLNRVPNQMAQAM